MSSVFAELRLVIRRSLANWRLLSTVMVGVLVTVALLSGAFLYSNAMDDLGLVHTLSGEPIEDLNLHVYAPKYLVAYEELDTAESIVKNSIPEAIGSIVRGEERWLDSQSFGLTWSGRYPLSPPYSFRFGSFTGLEEHVVVADGEYATPLTFDISDEELLDPDFAVEAMIGREVAEVNGISTGLRLIVAAVGPDGEFHVFYAEITALIDPADPTDDYWMNYGSEFFGVPESSADFAGWVPVVFIPEPTMFEVLPRLVKDFEANYHFFRYIDLLEINSVNASVIRDDVKGFKDRLQAALPRSGLLTRLDGVIRQYQSKLTFTRVPLFLIVAQITAIVLYYLVTVSSMLIDRQAGEIALFRSRGASTRQIISIYFIEGLLISAIGAAVGPFLGGFVFSLLGRTASFTPLTGGRLLPVRFSGTVFVLAAGAALLCLLALMVPAIQAARRGVVHHRQEAARPSRRPFWQRYYLDLVLLVLGAVLYWEMHQRGTLVNMDILGGMGVDPLLLVTPILFLVAVAIVFLRVFPILVSLATRLSRYLANTPSVLGLWYMARNPVHYGRLILLLMMAASVGMFSATFLGTLERSYEERALYTAGADVRLYDLNYQGGPRTAFYDTYLGLPGVVGASPTYRGDARVGTRLSQTSFTLLAVDPATFGGVAWYRDDFFGQPVSGLMDLLAEDTPASDGFVLPDDTEAVGMWVRPEEGNLETRVTLRIRDGEGQFLDHTLGTTSSLEWQYLEVRLDARTGKSPPPPISLVAIYVKALEATGTSTSPQGIYFDDLQVTGPPPETPVVIEDFEGIQEWTIMSDETDASFLVGGIVSSGFSVNRNTVHGGDASALLSWSRARSGDIRGVYPDADSRPLSVIASRSFMATSRLSMGDTVYINLDGQFIKVLVVSIVDYFPTLDPGETTFLIASLDRLSGLRVRDMARPIYPNEGWFALSDDSEERTEAVALLASPRYGAEKMYDTGDMVSTLRADPLAGAGWSGMLTIAFLGVILVSSLGFMVYSYLSAQQRQLDFAILRTLGFSLGQIIGLVCFEQLFIIIAGMGIGTIIGERLSYIMLPFLQLTEMGERVIPSLVLTVNWGTIGTAYVIIALAFIVTISLVILFFSRVAIHRTLRMGDM